MSLSTGALQWEPGGTASLFGTLKIQKRRLWKWSISLYMEAL